MTTKIGIGVISFAHGHANAYCQRMLTYADVKLVACWDDNEQRGQKAADTYGMIYTPHVEDVLNHPDIQGVIVTCADRTPISWQEFLRNCMSCSARGLQRSQQRCFQMNQGSGLMQHFARNEERVFGTLAQGINSGTVHIDAEMHQHLGDAR